MDEGLADLATGILSRLPGSVEMPAGTGKTQIVAALAAVAARNDSSTLILTHTHAGVDAIRRRLRRFNVPEKKVRVDTIAGWAFDLVRSYPQLAQMSIPRNPDWSKSAEYVAAATLVLKSEAIQHVHKVSFDHLIVDEYQDCAVSQGLLVRALAVAIPSACVFGDRLQGIFRFGTEDLVSWDSTLFESYPAIEIEVTPWRWVGHNVELGRWLMHIRDSLLTGQPLAIRNDVEGLVWRHKANVRAQLASEANRVCALGGA